MMREAERRAYQNELRVAAKRLGLPLSGNIEESLIARAIGIVDGWIDGSLRTTDSSLDPAAWLRDAFGIGPLGLPYGGGRRGKPRSLDRGPRNGTAKRSDQLRGRIGRLDQTELGHRPRGPGRVPRRSAVGDDRAASQVSRDRGRIDRRGHDHQSKIGSCKPRLPCECQPEISVNAALVEFIDDDGLEV